MLRGVRVAEADPGGLFRDDDCGVEGVAAVREGVALGGTAQVEAERGVGGARCGVRLIEGDGGRAFSSDGGRFRLLPLPSLPPGVRALSHAGDRNGSEMQFDALPQTTRSSGFLRSILEALGDTRGCMLELGSIGALMEARCRSRGASAAQGRGKCWKMKMEGGEG